MSAERQDEADVKRFEQTLAAFAPAPPQIDRDRLMFLAGQAMASGGREPAEALGRKYWLWPASTAALAATSLGLAIALFTRPVPQAPIFVQGTRVQPSLVETAPPPVVSNANAPAPPRVVTAAPAIWPLEGESYVKTREVAFRMGLDALGAPRAGRSDRGGSLPAPTYAELLESLAGGAPPGRATATAERLPNNM
jgi:hypothetical protein